MKQLTDEQITYLENWAKEKRKNQMADYEKAVVKEIEMNMKNNWRGKRKVTSKKDRLLEELEMLKGGRA